MRRVIKNIPLDRNNIESVLEANSGKSDYKQALNLIALQGGRDIITKEKMCDKNGNSTAIRIPGTNCFIDNKNRELAKNFTTTELENMQKELIILINAFNRGVLNNG